MSRLCPNCSSSIKQDDIFCPFCGVDTSKFNNSSSKTGDVNCSSCGSLNQIGIQFCSNCGSPISVPHGGSSFGSEPVSESTTYTYGSATPQPTGKRPWYKPPERTKSAKHPSEWLFWTGWGLYVFLRFLFQILFFALMIGLRSRRR
ncbi:MAG: zinc ribbon domain-containing protein [Asgard group archaeon]|nr:zinc ribbon domain-containing protein [Asgard group archaeon]